MNEDRSTPFVVLGVTGGIAAYKAIEICRQLVDAGCHVAPVLTKDACRFVTPLTFSALASEPAQTELYDGVSPIPHTRLGQQADLIVIAPATANLLARLAHGFADDLLTNTLLATRAPVLVAPAMHTEMWEQASVQENVATLRARGVHIVGPASGHLAGGDEGAGRLEDPSVIVQEALAVMGNGKAEDLAGVSIVISAGGTREAIDPVRVLTNRSSGKQGHALAKAAIERGADVTLVTTSRVPVGAVGPGTLSEIFVDSADEMYGAMVREAKAADVVVMAAAVADFRPVTTLDSKFKKESGNLSITLEPTRDILTALTAQRAPGQLIVGFAAETDDVLANARAKLLKKNCDLMVVNDVSAPAVGFDHDTNEVTILDRSGREDSIALASKSTIANVILDRVTCSLVSTKGEQSP
jgi:phosphopantothenoylcysteine decarboxylase/phosphopantothenate--cysteine ligase